MNPKAWNAESIGELFRGFQTSCVALAATELEIFDPLAQSPLTAEQLAAATGSDLRSLTILLDALAAIGLLEKEQNHYQLAAGVGEVLTRSSPASQLAMGQHLANCLRNWAQLASVVKSGQNPPRPPSIRGPSADYAAFIDAMNWIAQSSAPALVAQLQPLAFGVLLDVGGASGTYTIAFLRANPTARAILFDLPQVIPQAQQRLREAGLMERVRLVAGDFYADPLPQGADLAWLSAIVHQNSRQQNRDLFARIFQALDRGGQVLVRDFIMDESRTQPVGGALFAVNMLANTPRGGTFTFNELREDLTAAGFGDVRIVRRDPTMHSVLAAHKP